jgi:hypothetical protein
LLLWCFFVFRIFIDSLGPFCFAGKRASPRQEQWTQLPCSGKSCLPGQVTGQAFLLWGNSPNSHAAFQQLQSAYKAASEFCAAWGENFLFVFL